MWNLLRLAIVIPVFLHASAIRAQSVIWNVSTDKELYALGEPVTLFVEACNTGTTTETVDIWVGAGVVDANGNPVYCFTTVPWVVLVDIPPGECRPTYHLNNVWMQDDTCAPMNGLPGGAVPPGLYRGAFNYANMDYFSVPFHIQQPQPVPIHPAALIILATLLGTSGFFLCPRFKFELRHQPSDRGVSADRNPHERGYRPLNSNR